MRKERAVKRGRLTREPARRKGRAGVCRARQRDVPGQDRLGEGTVHVFDLEGHPRATRAYAWSHLVGDTGDRWRFFAVLHLGGIRSPRDAAGGYRS